MSRRVVIVGAGVLGLACASELAGDPALDVTVIDRSHPGAGSTGLSVGVFTRAYLSLEDVEIRVRGVAALEALQEQGLNLRRIGLLRLARDEATLARLEGSVAAQRERGVNDARVLSVAEIAGLVPAADLSGVTAGLWCPGDGYLDGAELCALLAELVQAAGGRIVGGTRLQGIERGRGPARVITDRGELPADIVINAAGAWATQVGELLEAPVEVVNERHEAYLFELPPDPQRGKLPMFMDYVPGGAEGLYFRQEGEHQLVAGLHSNDVLGEPVNDPDHYFRGATDAGAEKVVEQLAAALPGLEEIGYRGGWAGLYPHSPDGQLVAGPHPDDLGVLVGGGLGGNGLSVALPLGRVLADWVRFGEPRSLPGAERLVPRPMTALTTNETRSSA